MRSRRACASAVANAAAAPAHAPYAANKVREALASHTPSDEDAAVLRWARCSCWSTTVKKLVLGIIPFACVAAAGLGVAVGGWALDPPCGVPLRAFVVVAAGILVGYVLLAAWSLFVATAPRSRVIASLVVPVAGVAWAVVGAVWLSSPAGQACLQSSPHLVGGSLTLKVLLLVVGSLTLCCTACCKTELYWQHGVHTLPPHEDLSVLSVEGGAGGGGERV